MILYERRLCVSLEDDGRICAALPIAPTGDWRNSGWDTSRTVWVGNPDEDLTDQVALAFPERETR